MSEALNQKEIMRNKILQRLTDFGFFLNEKNELIPPSFTDKESIRKLHLARKNFVLEKDKEWILKNENRLFKYFADGKDIDPESIDPILIEIKTEHQSEIFRYATYLWSIPVSRGYARNLRYLVMDQYNNKLIGIFGLTDPIIGLKTRDDFIGWNKNQKEDRLWHVMDAYVLGAVPPYNILLGGKLVASLMTSNQVRSDFKNKYGGTKAVISGKCREGHLVLITTTAALGKSSLLSRLYFSRNDNVKDRRPLWDNIGYTEGYGHFHLDSGLADEMVSYLKSTGNEIVKKNRFGNGPQWKMRVLRTCLSEVRLNTDFLKHGVKRGVYISPLARNYQDFLKGKTNSPKYYNQTSEMIFSYFQRKYLIPRSIARSDWKYFNNESIRVSNAQEKDGE
jgi:hypothetical protein